ncbi:uncharacterized protein BX663DRAFT_540089 [Cokeromyces recurvatus]|uniref:uncharacterized protein n=1 Tax=Cokeromyces recurvatus TaxID=90255 RepID=UPI0022212808|nr:uncharacterized protein BX663DRAFT_540089 [Cokeromyces recurvatus]KAI7906275.1 hypothetical protein BX663DRAFT_540089 [Cokeromyces recurvatus]
MPTELRDYINSFNKNIIQELRSQIFQSQEFDQEYSHKDSHDYDWVRFTICALLREYGSGSLEEEHSEAWYMAHVWHFIDTVFNGEDKITVLRGETSSSSSSKRKNKDRSIAAVEPLERKKIGKKCDMIFAKKSCSHDEVEEYGASEAGKAHDGDQATKRLEEGYVKLPVVIVVAFIINFFSKTKTEFSKDECKMDPYLYLVENGLLRDRNRVKIS